MKIIVKRQDGGVSIMHIIQGSPEDEITKSGGLTNQWMEVTDEQITNKTEEQLLEILGD